MSITSINTNVNALLAQNQLRKLDFSLNTTMTRLSTGLRLNSAADGPSDLALSNNMMAHVRGVRQAVNNAEDALSLLAYADSALNETMDILQRMNDLAVKASNQAILTSSDVQAINSEVQSLKTELARRSNSVSFNSKILFDGSMSAGTTASGQQVVQIGADNGAAFKLTLIVYKMNLSGLGMNSGAFAGANFWGAGSLNISNIATGAAGLNQSALGAAVAAIDMVQSAIGIASDMQAALGVQEVKLQGIINDLSAEDLNLTAARSRISDADMAAEISEFTRLQILTQSSTAMLAQANMQPQIITNLLGTA